MLQRQRGLQEKTQPQCVADAEFNSQWEEASLHPNSGDVKPLRVLESWSLGLEKLHFEVFFYYVHPWYPLGLCSEFSFKADLDFLQQDYSVNSVVKVLFDELLLACTDCSSEVLTQTIIQTFDSF